MCSKISGVINATNLKKGMVYLRSNGIKALVVKARQTIFGAKLNYEKWYKKHIMTNEEEEAERSFSFFFSPYISIIVPVYNTPISFLTDMMESVMAQTYSNWELCIACGSGENAELVQTLENYHVKDARIKYVVLEANEGISGNTNRALELASGDYIGLLDHDDMLTSDALFQTVKAINEHKCDMLYSDEDNISADGKRVMNPNFKPDFDIELLRTHNYITHFLVVSRELVEKVGSFDKAYDGAQDYDFILRCSEKAKCIYHIAKILYHWRSHAGSVSGNFESKNYAFEAGRRALEKHLVRCGCAAQVKLTGLPAVYETIYRVKDNPLVSIVIPNKDHVKELRCCINSLLYRNIYENIEIIVVENNSKEEETFAYYEELGKKAVRVLYWRDKFNYASINNFGAQNASGDYILFLNNDTELIAEDAIARMLGMCQQENTGIVGAKLLYQDNTIQHAGIILGLGGFAGHIFKYMKDTDLGYMKRAGLSGSYSAVTGACLMIKRSVFDEVKGFDPVFEVALNDVDLCLRVGERGYATGYSAEAKWYHYESKSRGYENTSEKKERFESELQFFLKRWGSVIDKGDPFYNKNFDINERAFSKLAD